MVFNSVVFLFCFLPLSLLLYYLVPGRAKNAVLLAESLIFYWLNCVVCCRWQRCSSIWACWCTSSMPTS